MVELGESHTWSVINPLLRCLVKNRTQASEYQMIWNRSTKRMLFRCFLYLHVRYSDLHCIRLLYILKNYFKTTSNLILKKSSNVNLSSEQCLGHAHIGLRVEVRPVPNEVSRLVDEHLDKVVVVLHRGGSLHHFLGDRDLEQLAVFTSWWYQDPKDKNQIIQSRLHYIQTMDS